jgi:hypothetical protein
MKMQASQLIMKLWLDLRSDAGHHHHHSEQYRRDADSEATKHLWRYLSKQRLADKLRCSNPDEAEEWHRYEHRQGSLLYYMKCSWIWWGTQTHM